MESRPITYADLMSSQATVLAHIEGLRAAVQENSTNDRIHARRLDDIDRHREEIQGKIDNAGIDGTSGRVATWAALKSTIYFVVLALGGLAWLFATFAVRKG